MGLITGLLLLPVAPVRGVVWVADRIAEQVEAERGGMAEELARIEDAKERGDLDPQVAAEREEELLEQRLRARPAPGTTEGANGG